MFRSTISAALLACVLSPVSTANAEANSGAYLAAVQAAASNDFASAARYFTKSLIGDATNPYLLENALTSYVALGQMERAIPIARAIVDNGHESQIAHMILSLAAAKSDNWADIFSALEANRNVSPLVDGLSQAWAHLGLGEMSKALASFDQVIEAEGLKVFGLNHKALALASVGDFEGADLIFATSATNGMRYSRRSAIAHAQILSQLGRNEDAIAILEGIFGNQLDPQLTEVHAALVAGESVAYDVISDPIQGLADVFLVVAAAIEGEAPDAFTLQYSRAAGYLNPDNTEAVLLTARLLEDLGQFDLSNDAFASIARDNPSFHAAELGRAEVLDAAGRPDAAIEVLEALSRSHPDLPRVHATAGDTLRRAEKFAEAKAAYTRAIALYDDQNTAKWFVHFTRGITNHHLDNWPEAEADFRAALNLRPDHPQVLNYLGYSLVERGQNLDEALGMIETAAASEPDNGAIVDSLGWVMFQLGRYQEAVGHMERAASLEPVDPVVNDHLGDVYWAVGRETEAQFQWNRALSFDPDEEDAARIRAKLERGLNAVLLEEGQDPILVARGND